MKSEDRQILLRLAALWDNAALPFSFRATNLNVHFNNYNYVLLFGVQNTAMQLFLSHLNCKISFVMNFRHLPVYRNQIKCVQRYGTCEPPRFPIISWHMSELPTKFGSYQNVLWREGKLFLIIRNLLQWFQTLWRHRFAWCCCCHLQKRLSTEIWWDINRNIKRLRH